MRTRAGAAIVCAALMCGDRVVSGTASDCSFRIAAHAFSPAIVGKPELTGRATIMAQPDSPAAIVRLDMTHSSLTVGGGTYEDGGRYVVDVINVSDRVLTDVMVSVRVGFALPESGGGSGFRVGRPLRPGETARIEWNSGRGRGTHTKTDDTVSIVGLISEIKTANCTYKPSQSWPNSNVGAAEVDLK